ncbi:MAG: VOC family protein [Bacteroidota bacterium]
MNLNQVTVPSLNVERSIAFYQRIGLRLIVKALPHYARFECPEGDSTFSVHLVAKLGEGEGVIVYFECVDLDDKVFELCESGMQFELMPTDQSWLWREAHLRDPDNNKIILFFAGEHRLNPPWRVGGSAT